MMLIDKSYYDYDFKKVNKPKKHILFEDTVKNEEQTRSMLARFGIGIGLKPKKDLTDMTLEELQEYAINDIKE